MGSILVTFCFVQVVAGYVNVAQITQVFLNDKDSKTMACLSNDTATSKFDKTADCEVTGDKTPTEFLERVKKTCGGKIE